MFGSALNLQQLRELSALLAEGETVPALVRRFGVAENVIRREAARIAKRSGIAIAKPASRVAEPRPSQIEPMKLAELQRLLDGATASNRDIVRATGVRLNSVNRARLRWLQARAESGQPQLMCACGKPRFHPRWCAASASRAREEQGASGSIRTVAEDIRREIIASLVRGDAQGAVARRYGLSKSTIKKTYLPKLSPEQAAVRERNRAGADRPAATSVPNTEAKKVNCGAFRDWKAALRPAPVPNRTNTEMTHA